MNRFWYGLFILLVLLAYPSPAEANVVWPALYAEAKIMSFPIILLSIVIEFFVIRWLFQLNIRQGLLYTVVANVVSMLFGMFLRPLAGIAYELSIGMLVNSLFGWGTFNPVAWCIVPISAALISTFLELVTICLIWKRKWTKRSFLFLGLANLLTASIATVWVILAPSHM